MMKNLTFSVGRVLAVFGHAPAVPGFWDWEVIAIVNGDKKNAKRLCLCQDEDTAHEICDALTFEQLER